MKNLTNIDKESENYKLGVSVGILAACQIILDKLNNSSKSFVNRISDVKSFCNNPYSLINKVSENNEK